MFCLGLIQTLPAQVPESFQYQAVARNAAGQVLADQQVGIRIRILAGSADGTEAYAETHQVQTSAQGLLQLQVGGGTPLSGNFQDIQWGTGPYFLEVSIDPAGGSNYTLLGASQILSVPYALLAKDVENNEDGDPDPLNEIQSLSVSGNTLFISDGNDVELPSLWTAVPDGISYTTGKVQLNNTGGNIQLELADQYAAGGRNLLLGDDAYLSDVDQPNGLGVFGNADSARGGILLGGKGPWLWGREGRLGIGTETPGALLHLKPEDGATAPALHIEMPDYAQQTGTHTALSVSSAWNDEGVSRTDILRLYDEESSPILEMSKPGYSYFTSLTPGSLFFRGESGTTLNLNWEEGLMYGATTAGFNLLLNAEYPLYYRTYDGTWTDRIRIDRFGNAYFAGDLQVDGTLTGSIHIDTVDVSRITGLLGQGYTLNFPDILNNLVSFELNGILNSKVVIISGVGHETERISTPYGYGGTGEMIYHEEPGLTQEYPLVFETLNETDADLVKAWFDDPAALPRDAAIVIRSLNGTETSRWNLYSYEPDHYEAGNDGRTRFTMKHTELHDNFPGCEWEGALGSEHSYNPATDKLVEIEGVNTGTDFTPAVVLNTDNRTVTLTLDYNEGFIISDWVYSTVRGTETDRAMSIVETTDGTHLTETGRFNYYDCVPIIYEHIYGFGLNTKLKIKIVIAYGWREEG